MIVTNIIVHFFSFPFIKNSTMLNIILFIKKTKLKYSKKGELNETGSI